MSNSLAEKLEQFYLEDPKDPFNVYALALEFAKDEPVRAETLFHELLRDHPEYLPTYYHAAHFFMGLGKNTQAAETFLRGIELAAKQHNLKALGELKAAYSDFQEEVD